MNLTQRFSLTHGFIALLAVSITLGVILGAAQHFFQKEIQDSQASQLKSFTLAAQESHFANDDMAVLNFIRLSAQDPMVVFAAFRGLQGKNIVLPLSFREADLTKGRRSLLDGRRIEVFSSAVQSGGRAIGNVVLAYDRGKEEALVQSELERWTGLTALAGTCALSVAFFLSVLLSKTLVSPLKRIKAGTEQVQAGKLDKLVDVDRSDEIGTLSRAFNEMIVKLKELEEMKRDFVAGVTHDFGTPLHTMQNALELLEEEADGPVTPQQLEHLLMISNNLHQLDAFIANLLTTSRIDAAKVEPYYEPVNSLAVAREVVGLYSPEAARKGIQLRVVNTEDSLTLVTDVTLFRQILTNLVSNAMKYTLKGGVSVSLSQADGISTLQVTDTGIGIDLQHQQLIFDRFFRVRQPKSFPTQPGSGLGLSIAKGLAETMGGSILVESRPGNGSTFIVKLLQREPSLSTFIPTTEITPKAGKHQVPSSSSKSRQETSVPRTRKDKKAGWMANHLPSAAPEWLGHRKHR